ncbi:MAG TPA: hypothetical protein VM240_05510 [Verrucomicrobiae bacterium]|nr:hypothetical protein [Verrucomicrobiae bacterium]
MSNRFSVAVYPKEKLVRVSGLDHWAVDLNEFELDRLIPALIEARRQLRPLGGGLFGRRAKDVRVGRGD